MKIYFLSTSTACPEQYSVYDWVGTQIGYVRLRWGELVLEYPSVNCELIYEHSFEDKMKGVFDSQDERKQYLQEMTEALKDKLHIEEEVEFVVVNDPDILMDIIYGKGEEV